MSDIEQILKTSIEEDWIEVGNGDEQRIETFNIEKATKELERYVNQQVLKALEEVKSKKINFYGIDEGGYEPAREATIAVTIDAIEEIERKYK